MSIFFIMLVSDEIVKQASNEGTKVPSNEVIIFDWDMM